MAWAKIDDQFADHPKVIAAGPLAGWLYVCGLTYCARLLTDGFIPTGQVRKLADLDRAMDLAHTLVEVGMWEEVGGGFQVTNAVRWGVGHEPQDQEIRNTQAYRSWRSAVLHRDGHRCRECGVTGVPLQSHHVKAFALYPEHRLEVDNGITLCVDCHSDVHGRRLA
jgi:hypothetical protein